MIEHPNLMNILPTAVFVFFLLAGEMLQQTHTKEIILESEENVIVSADVFQITLLVPKFTVKCSYSGASQINGFQWERIDSNKWPFLEEIPNKIYNRSQWLTFNELTIYDVGLYTCSINGIKGNETFSEKRGFILVMDMPYDKNDINQKPEFQKKKIMDTVPLFVNSTLRLDCPFSSSSDTEFSWYRNNKLLIERKAILIETFARVDNHYSLHSVKLSDAGNYSCVVRNTAGSIRHDFKVVVYENGKQMPSDVEYPRSLSLRSGETAHFNCSAFDYLFPYKPHFIDIEWYYLNFTNPMDIDIETVDLSRFKIIDRKSANVEVTKSDLILKNVTIHDAGWYICLIAGIDQMLMAEAKLDVDTITTLDNADSTPTVLHTEECNNFHTHFTHDEIDLKAVMSYLAYLKCEVNKISETQQEIIKILNNNSNNNNTHS